MIDNQNDGEEYLGRLKTLAIIFFFMIVILIARVGYLQIYDGDYYANLAEGNRIRIIPTTAPRGTFYDRNGQLLVTNSPGFSVSLLPLTAPIKPEVVERVSKLLNVPKEEIEQSAQNDGVTLPGDFRFKDLNHDGKIDSEDRTYIGSPHPDFTFGIPINLAYKQFELSIFLQGQVGGKLFNVEYTDAE